MSGSILRSDESGSFREYWYSLLMMFSLVRESWARLIIWLAVGLVIYLFYGRKHSKVQILNRAMAQPKAAPSMADSAPRSL
jgi:hypothetical protein